MVPVQRGPASPSPRSRRGAAAGRRRGRARSAFRAGSQLGSWVLKRPSRERLGYVSAYLTLRCSGEFDAEYYRSRSPDVVDQDPLMHYVEHGAKEGRDPSPDFSTADHLRRYPGLLEAGINPFVHYLKRVRPALAQQREVDLRAQGELLAGLPAGATALVAIGPGSELVEPDGLEVRRFAALGADPGAANPLSGSRSAIAQLESQRARGADHLVIPADALDWLVTCPPFRRYLDRHYRQVFDADEGMIFALDRADPSALPWPGRLQELVEQHQARFRARPSLLDWGTGLVLASRLPELTVLEPPVPGQALPYLDHSIDLVALGNGEGESRELEARRVAANGVISVHAREDSIDLEIDWLRDADRRLPSVSVVIPSFDGATHLENCLKALSETVPAGLDVEFLVVDDASADSTAALLARWSERESRLRHLRNDANAGFVDSCNRGAAEARGDLLVFLNNDTIPLHGWLQPLVGTLEEREDAGAVGGMLIYPSGSLQEAGAIVFSDGSAANFGNGDPEPDRPLYRFLREVDYCSGALLATRRALFEEIGGFDALYRPGYYEDVDYCFRLRSRGLKTYYQPQAAVVHLEGGTAGSDVLSGPKRYQVVNRAKFEQRWRESLRSHPARPKVLTEAASLQLARHRPPGVTRPRP